MVRQNPSPSPISFATLQLPADFSAAEPTCWSETEWVMTWAVHNSWGASSGAWVASSGAWGGLKWRHIYFKKKNAHEAPWWREAWGNCLFCLMISPPVSVVQRHLPEESYTVNKYYTLLRDGQKRGECLWKCIVRALWCLKDTWRRKGSTNSRCLVIHGSACVDGCVPSYQVSLW